MHATQVSDHLAGCLLKSVYQNPDNGFSSDLGMQQSTSVKTSSASGLNVAYLQGCKLQKLPASLLVPSLHSLRFLLLSDNRLRGPLPASMVQLSVLSNHGLRDFTCLYRVRVHGEPAE